MTTAQSNDPLTIARRLLLSAPPGQFDAILADLRVLLSDDGDGVMTEEFVAEVRQENSKLTGCALIYGAGSDSSGGGGERCATLRSRMDAYLCANYATPTATDSNDSSTKNAVSTSYSVSPSTTATSPNSINLTTYCQRLSPQNYHSGSWLCRYTVEVLSSTSASVKGNVVIRAHTYENGNVMLCAKRKLGPITVSASNEDDWADAVLSQIQSWERTEVQQSLAELYDNVGGKDSRGSNMLKLLRRVMPVTRTKMDWSGSVGIPAGVSRGAGGAVGQQQMLAAAAAVAAAKR